MATEVVIKRVYDQLKQQVMTYHIKPGTRLNIGHLADDLGVSTTPVREVLNRLVSEGLIDDVPQIGFFVHHPTEHEIRNLYDLNRLLLDWSLGALRKGHLVTGLVRPPRLFPEPSPTEAEAQIQAEALVQITEQLFNHVASQSHNREIVRKIRNINDRLHYIRLHEPDFLPNAQTELLDLCRLYYQKNYRGLRDALKTYHDARTALVENLLTLILSCECTGKAS
ncbi:GntR family transcriptional regulator [Luteithermobacter gelatinilyticus]|uniref:GntR family transcriptional regulator n=1 Tax=Luteithermobacter gelatinilyticus TaxID=2582913 RepID=UPI001105BC8B|nr:GntR family transcriptional regulator [Luteithermobacter gelatinilyticus]